MLKNLIVCEKCKPWSCCCVLDEEELRAELIRLRARMRSNLDYANKKRREKAAAR